MTDTQIFFARLRQYWDHLGPGYLKENLNLVDPISGKRIKTVKVVHKYAAMDAAPILLELSYHHVEETTKLVLKKGVDLRTC